MNLLELMISIGVDDQASDKIEGISTGLVAKGNIISNAFSRVMGAVSSSMDSAVNRLDIINNFPKVMTNLGISADAATESINILKGDALKGLPTSLESAVASVQRFTSVNGDVLKSTDYFLAPNNAIVAGGANAASQASALEQLSQAYAKGAADGQEWRSLQLAMPAQLEQVAKAFNTTTVGLRESMKAGEVSMEDFMQALVKLNEEGLEGFGTLEEQARAATGGIATQIVNVQNAINRALANVIDGFNSSNVVNKAITMLTNAINTIGNTIKPIAEKIGTSLGVMLDRIGEAFAPIAAQLPMYAQQFAEAFGKVANAVAEAVNVVAPALPAIAKIAPLLLTVHAATSSLAGSLTNLATNVIPRFVTAGTLTEAIGTKMAASVSTAAAKIGGPYTIAIMAAVTALGALAIAYTDAQAKQEQFGRATDGLMEAASSLSAGAKGAAGSVKAIGDAASDAEGKVQGHVVSLTGLIGKQEQLADAISSSFAGVGEQSATLEASTEIIARLADNCGGSATKVAELQAAVEKYNSITGANVSIVDEQTGKLDVSTGAILANADAWEANAKAQAAQEALVDLNKALLESKLELAEAEKQESSALKALNEYQGDDMNVKAQLASQYDILHRRADQARELNESAGRSYATCAAEIRANSDAAAEATARLGDMADSEEGLNDKLHPTTDAVSEQAGSLKDAAAAMKDYLDGVYDAQKSAYDAEYKQQQRAYSRAEREFSRQQSREYDALKKSLDSRYDAQKDAYDKEYSARKKSLDAQYDELKDSLSDELDAVKKANDQTLSELKKSQSAQVDAFKEATKQRIAAIEEEYDARKRLLESDKDSQTKVIEDQIAALKGQTKAESREQKLSQQMQKRAELEKEAQTGKTYKVRQQAAKDLQELLVEIERDRVEQEREIQIDALEEQKDRIKEEYDAKKQELSDELSDRKEQITNERDEELAAIKDANDREYQALKEHLEAQETAIGEANDAKLAAMKDSHEQSLQVMKEQQQEDLQSIKDANQDRLDALREAQEDQRSELGNYYSDQLDALRAAQEEQLQALKDAHEEQLQELESTVAAEDELGKGAAGDAMSNAQQAVENVRKAIADGRSPVSAVAEAIRKAVNDNISELPDDMEDTSGRGMDGFVREIADSESTAGTAAGDIARAVVDGVNDLPDDMYTVFQNMAYGMENGANSVDIATWAYNTAWSIRDTFTSIFDVRSPSHVMFDIFRNVALGARDGIERNADAVVGSAEDMAHGVLDAIDEAYGGMGRFDGMRLQAARYASQPVAGPASAGGVVITGNTFNVRNDSDIELIADKLMTLIDRKRGAGSWSPAFTMA